MSKYRIGSVVMETGQAGAGDMLQKAHDEHVRPLCLCKNPPPPMYVARVGRDKFIVKRMPNTGAHHAPECDSYEMPAELSGLGEVIGSAIQEDVEAGTTALKLDFSLTKLGSRKAPAAGGGDEDTVRTDGKKLTLRGLLHYLWDEAGFNRWSPGMAGKRNWGVVRKYLLEAVANKEAKGSALAASVYVPESFHPDRKAELAARRSAKMAPLMSGGSSGRKLMVLVGEVKDIEEARYGFKIVVKHLPDYHFMLNEDIHARLHKRFATELAMWRSGDGTRLMVIATFGVGATGWANIEEASLMAVTPEWLPVETGWENMLVRELVSQERQFVKGLRFNLASNRPLAAVVTSDTKPVPVAMYVVPDDGDEAYLKHLRLLSEESALPSWYWRTGPDQDVPKLPEREGFEGQDFPAAPVRGAGEIITAEHAYEEADGEGES